jgi:hypothetical protein
LRCCGRLVDNPPWSLPKRVAALLRWWTGGQCFTGGRVGVSKRESRWWGRFFHLGPLMVWVVSWGVFGWVEMCFYI